ncbi:MAG: hypothetical protein HYX51_10800 [Chloroflexi bacterium]|nr:hypothetical protein [Chloroflexota bacterium]
MDRPEWDEVDRALHAAAPPPPSELGQRLLRRAAVERRARRLLAALLGDLAALLCLSVLSMLVARALTGGGTGELLLLAIEDREVVRAGFREYLTAVMAALPWPWIALLALDVLLMIRLTRYLARATELPARSEGREP